MDYSLKDLQYIPAAMFKLYCANMRKGYQSLEFPKLFRQMQLESKAKQEIAYQLLDLKSKSLIKAKAVFAKDPDERYKIPQLQNTLRKNEMYFDVLPFVYQMLHPQLRDVGSQLYTNDEKKCFKQAIELMITFDIKLTDVSEQDKF